MDETSSGLAALTQSPSFLHALIAIAVGILVFILTVRLGRRADDTPARVKRAEQLGHVVTAQKIRTDYAVEHHTDRPYHYADYRYEVDGQTYRFRFAERRVPPQTITLYYIHSPRHAFWGQSRTADQAGKTIIRSLLPFAAAVVTMLILEGVL